MADERRQQTTRTSERWGLEVPWLERATRGPAEDAARRPRSPRRPGEIPRVAAVGRSAKLGAAIGSQATRYAGTAAANLGRSEERKAERLETRHVESALKMASVLGEMKGAAMKIGQMASFIDVDFLPPEYREIYQEQLGKLRADAPAMPWEQVREVLESRSTTASRWSASSPRSTARRSRPPRSARSTARRLHDGSEVAVKIQYPGVAEALESDLANAGILVRVAKALAPGLDAKAIAGELRERVLEELDYEFEAQNQRAFARAYDGHPFIYVPQGPLAALAAARAGQRVRRGPRLRPRQARSPRTSATSSARSSSASASARSTTCSTSTPTPTRATTC